MFHGCLIILEICRFTLIKVAHYSFFSLGQSRTQAGANQCLETGHLANLKINQAHCQNGWGCAFWKISNIQIKWVGAKCFSIDYFKSKHQNYVRFRAFLSQFQQQTATFLQKQGAWKPCFYIGNLPSTKQQWRKLGVKGLDFL